MSLAGLEGFSGEGFVILGGWGVLCGGGVLKGWGMKVPLFSKLWAPFSYRLFYGTWFLGIIKSDFNSESYAHMEGRG